MKEGLGNSNCAEASLKSGLTGIFLFINFILRGARTRLVKRRRRTEGSTRASVRHHYFTDCARETRQVLLGGRLCYLPVSDLELLLVGYECEYAGLV